MKNSSSELGQYLRSLRIQKGLTLHQVAKEADIDSPMLSKIERGGRLPTQDQLKRLSVFFQVSESELKVMHTAEKIIKEYGVNDTTYNAAIMVCEQMVPYIKRKRPK